MGKVGAKCRAQRRGAWRRSAVLAQLDDRGNVDSPPPLPAGYRWMVRRLGAADADWTAGGPSQYSPGARRALARSPQTARGVRRQFLRDNRHLPVAM